jgi:hypothetical protein
MCGASYVPDVTFSAQQLKPQFAAAALSFIAIEF